MTASPLARRPGCRRRRLARRRGPGAVRGKLCNPAFRPWTMGVRPATNATATDGPSRRGTFAFAPGGRGVPHPVRARAVALARRLSARCRRLVLGIERRLPIPSPSPSPLGSDSMRTRTTLVAAELLTTDQGPSERPDRESPLMDFYDTMTIAIILIVVAVNIFFLL